MIVLDNMLSKIQDSINKFIKTITTIKFGIL
jgi:hypothetical protein